MSQTAPQFDGKEDNSQATAGEQSSTPQAPWWHADWNANAITGVSCATLVITAASLGVWRALSIGGDGIAAAGLILSAATLISTFILLYAGIAWKDKRDLPRIPPAYSVTTLVISLLATLLLGNIGRMYYAHLPVDVTSKFRWNPGINRPSSAILTIPKKLDRLSIRALIVPQTKNTGSCLSPTFDVLRAGTNAATRQTPSGETAHVKIPQGVRRLQVSVELQPDLACNYTLHVEKAEFYWG